MTAHAQTITVNGSGAATPVVRAIDDGGSTLVLNLDPNNTIFIGADTSAGPGNQNNSAPIGPSSGSIFDGTFDVYASCATGQTAQVAIFPGVQNYFQLLAVIVSTLIISASAGNGLFVYNGPPGGPSWDVQFSGNGSTANPQANTTAVIPATAGNTYTSSAWLSTSQNSAGGVQLILQFFNSSFGVLSTFTSGEITSTSPEQATVSGLAPAGTAWASVIIQANGTPTSTDVFSAAAAPITTGIQVPSTGFTAWQFQDSATGTVLEPWNPVSSVSGNLVGSWSPVAGTDQYGNTYPAGLYVSQSITIGQSGQSQIMLNPDANQELSVTSAIAGVLQAAGQFSTTDSNEVVAGIIGSMLLNTGSSTKMSTVLGSPFASNGAYILLESENDGGTDTAIITFGTVSTPDDGTTLVYAPILTLTPYALLMYGGQSGQTVVTQNNGSGTIPIPSNAVSPGKGECWGPGGGGGGAEAVNRGSQAAGGGGGGGYSQEPALAFTPGGTVSYSIGGGGSHGGGTGNGSPGSAATTLTGSAVTVTANPGQGGGSANNGGAGGAGGTASSNTISYPGGTTEDGGANDGSGGGSSAGPGGAGKSGFITGGGIAPNGGGNGGPGGADSNGGVGASPGGGGGGAGPLIGSGASAGGNGASGQTRLTYTTGAPAILLSIASVAGTDQFGTAYPAGFQMVRPSGLAEFISGGQTADFTNFTVTAATATQCTKAWSIPANDAKVGTVYRLTLTGNGTQGTTAQTLGFLFSNGDATATIASAFAPASGAFRWKVVMEIHVITTGASGTANYIVTATAGVGIQTGYTQGAAFDSAAAFTLEGESEWGSTTGAPTMTCFDSYLERIGP
jgi:hypothetical protein